MDVSSNSLNTEELLAHASWVRSLAKTLVRHDDQADDLVQEAMLVALQHSPDTLKNPKGWLATVTRNLAVKKAIKEKNRIRREMAIAKEEPISGFEDTEEHLSQHHKLVEFVKNLEEPYRTTLVLRFFEDLTPKQISERLGIPAATVRTHLSRALEKLRAKLDREYGNRRAWCLAFLPLAGLKKAAAPVSLFSVAGMIAFVVRAEVKFAAAVLLILGFSLFLFRFSWGTADLALASVPSASKSENVVRVPVSEASQSDENSRNLITQAEEKLEVLPSEQKVVQPKIIQGLVTDVTGQIAPNAKIEMWKETNPGFHRRSTPSSVLLADASGRFQFTYPTDAKVIIASTVNGISYAFGPKSLDRVQEVKMILYPSVRLPGNVFRANGEPAVRAKVHVINANYWSGAIISGEPWEPVPIDTGLQGQFTIDIFFPLTHLLWAEDGDQKTNAILVNVTSGVVRRVALNFPGAYSLYGLLRDSNGQVVKGGKVVALGILNAPLANKFSEYRVGEVNEDGYFDFQLSLPGKFQILAYNEDLSQSGCSNIEIKKNEKRVEAQLIVQPNTHISGRLKDPTGIPLAEIELIAIPPEFAESMQCLNAYPVDMVRLSAKTDIVGRFEFKNVLPWGRYEIVLGSMAKGERHKLQACVKPREVFDISVTAAMLQPDFIVGRVVHPDTEIAKEYTLDLIEEVQQGKWVWIKDAKFKKYPDGTFRVDELVYGHRYVVRAFAEGYTDSESEVLRAGTQDQEVVIRLKRPINFDCRLVNKLGQPIVGCRLIAQLSHYSIFSERHFIELTDKDGIAHFKNLTPGHYSWTKDSGKCDGGLTPRTPGNAGGHPNEFELPEGRNTFLEVIATE